MNRAAAITVGLFFAWLTLFVFVALHAGTELYGDYRYDNEVGGYWSLSIKASSLEQKTIYLDKFISALDSNGLAGMNDSLILSTPNNSYDQNMVALKSLQKRMHEMQSMDVSSLEYQQAMNQITGQEQGDSREMTTTLRSIWFKKNYFFLYGGIDLARWVAEILAALVLWIMSKD